MGLPWATGMLYSLPSRELIADSVEYMVNAHCADAMVCISNCDKITPGMLMASLRLNIPVIFVSGGPMEAGKTKLSDQIIKLDLVDAMIRGADPKVSDSQSDQVERSACPTCGSCSGMFTANSMNCLTEALGLSQPGNGSLLATHSDRKQLFLNAGKRIVELTKRYYEQNDESALPRNIASKAAFENAMTLDIAMGGSTNTVLHLLAAAQEAEIDFTMSDIDKLSRKVPQLCKVAPSTQKYHMEDVHRAGGVIGILGELDRAGLLNRDVKNVLGLTLPQTLEQYDVMLTRDDAVKICSAPALRVSVPPGHSRKIAVGIRWTTIAPMAVSARWNTPIAKTAARRCSTVISRKTAASLKLRASMTASSNSPARRKCTKAVTTR